MALKTDRTDILNAIYKKTKKIMSVAYVHDIIKLGHVNILKWYIKNNKEYSYNFFAVDKYNKLLTTPQIMRLGNCLISLRKEKLNYEVVKEFINNNLKRFNDDTLDYLYNLASSDNEGDLLFDSSSTFSSICSLISSFSSSSIILLLF